MSFGSASALWFSVDDTRSIQEEDWLTTYTKLTWRASMIWQVRVESYSGTEVGKLLTSVGPCNGREMSFSESTHPSGYRAVLGVVFRSEEDAHRYCERARRIREFERNSAFRIPDTPDTVIGEPTALPGVRI